MLEGTRKNAQCLSFTLHLLPNPHPSFKSPPTPRFAWSSRAASSPHLTLHFLSHLQVCLVLSCCQPHLTCLDLWRCSSLTARGVAALAACTQLKVTPSQPLSCEHSLMKISKKDLDLGWCLGVQAATGALLSLIEACPGLTRLCLTAHRQVFASSTGTGTVGTGLLCSQTGRGSAHLKGLADKLPLDKCQ